MSCEKMLEARPAGRDPRIDSHQTMMKLFNWPRIVLFDCRNERRLRAPDWFQ
jgi:hypothetical protein